MTQISASGAAVIPLAYPIETKCTTLPTIIMRRPKVRDMLATKSLVSLMKKSRYKCLPT